MKRLLKLYLAILGLGYTGWGCAVLFGWLPIPPMGVVAGFALIGAGYVFYHSAFHLGG